MESSVLVGHNAVLEYLKTERPVKKVLLAADTGRNADIVALLKKKGITHQFVQKAVLDRMANGERHQGVLAYIEAYAYVDLDTILEIAANREEPPFILALDGLEDPHNLGALVRTAEAVGVHGIVIPNRRSVDVTPTVIKISAGAAAHIAVARVTNLVQALKKLQEAGCWISGAEHNGKDIEKADLSGPRVIAVGSEGKGLSRLVRETCDEIVTLSMRGKINSLNASVAGGILLYQSFLQRKFERTKIADPTFLGPPES